MLRVDPEEFQVSVFKALGHPTRLKIVKILASQGEKCVCELVEALGCDQSTVSKHLSVLKAASIVSSSKSGLMVTYALKLPCVYGFLRCLEAPEVASDLCNVCERACKMEGV